LALSPIIRLERAFLGQRSDSPVRIANLRICNTYNPKSDSFGHENPRRILGAVWNDLFLVLSVPLFDSFGTNVMDSVREGDALTEVPARRPAELARAPLDKLGEILHKI